jgi:DNA-binding CsgD family transcriptional regulator
MGRLISDRCILDLVEHIYAAGCDPGEWKSVATRVQGAIPDTAFNVLMSVKGTELAANSTSVGIAEEHLKSYFEHYQFINPYNQFFAKLPVGQITTIGTMFEQRWVKAQPFYHEWLKPAGGFTHGAGAVLARDEKRLLRVTIDIPEHLGHVEDPAARLLDRLRPHLMRAFGVNERLSAAVATRQALLLIVESLNGAALIMDSGRRVVTANTAAELLLRMGSLIKCGMDGRLAFRSPGYEEQFRRVLANACDSGRADEMTGFSAVDSSGMARHVIVLPLRPTTTIVEAVPSQPLALVVFRDASPAMAVPNKVLQSLYGLTPTEASIAADVASGLNLAEMAEKRSIAHATVRNQLGSAMSKMGVHRQAELVSTVLALAPRIGSVAVNHEPK